MFKTFTKTAIKVSWSWPILLDFLYLLPNILSRIVDSKRFNKVTNIFCGYEQKTEHIPPFYKSKDIYHFSLVLVNTAIFNLLSNYSFDAKLEICSAKVFVNTTLRNYNTKIKLKFTLWNFLLWNVERMNCKKFVLVRSMFANLRNMLNFLFFREYPQKA